MVEPLYVAAREVLLDALEALAEHRDSIILVGAQAIYVHTGDADVAVSAFTTDADLVIDSAHLRSTPPIERLMVRAMFRPGQQPGSWLRDHVSKSGSATVPVDLLVPEAIAGPGRRSARLGEHGDRAARRARGLEGTLVDRDPHLLESLLEGQRRSSTVQVAGPSALLVAKLHKIADRSGELGTKRLKDKDALDILRILRAIPIQRLAGGLTHLLATSVSREVTSEAVRYLYNLFGTEDGEGIQMAVRATERLEDPAEIAASCVALARELLDQLPAKKP